MDRKLLEVCIDSVESGIAAQQGGAARVELCDNLYEGGTTPSAATIEIARKYLHIGINVMIRPRGSDFCYSPIEFEIMQRDVQIAKKLGADAVVFGILRPNGTVDTERSKQLIELARPLKVTFHRAFDMTRDPFEALEDLIAIGTDRILTAGHQPSVPKGIDLIATLHRKAAGRIAIMAGSGVREHNLAQIIERTKISEFHTTARKAIESTTKFRKPQVPMASLKEIPEYQIFRADKQRIERMVKILES